MTLAEQWAAAQRQYRIARGGDRLRAHRRLVKKTTALLRAYNRSKAKRA